MARCINCKNAKAVFPVGKSANFCQSCVNKLRAKLREALSFYVIKREDW